MHKEPWWWAGIIFCCFMMWLSLAHPKASAAVTEVVVVAFIEGMANSD